MAEALLSSAEESDAARGIAHAVALKQEGNEHFQHGRFKQAMVAYHQIYLHVHGFACHDALPTPPHPAAANGGPSSPADAVRDLAARAHDLVHHGSPSSLPPPAFGRMLSRLLARLMVKPASRDELAQINALKLAHHSNLAMCHLRLGGLRKARDCCSRALEIDPANVKSLFRRGRCHALMGELDEARADLAAVLRIQPTNREASKELLSLRARYAEHKARETKRFAGMFDHLTSLESDKAAPRDIVKSSAEPLGATDAELADSVSAADIHSLLMADACIDSIDLNELRAAIAARPGASGKDAGFPLGEITSLRDLEAYLREMNINLRPSDLIELSQASFAADEDDAASPHPPREPCASPADAAPASDAPPSRQQQIFERALIEAVRAVDISKPPPPPPAAAAPPLAAPPHPLPPRPGGEGKALLHVVRKIREAARAGNTEQLRKLLKGGTDVNMREADSDSPALYLASLKGHASCIQLLLAHHADVDALTKEGLCSLYASCQSGKAECVELLLAANAKVDLPNKKGSTPLYMACLNGHVDCARLMLGARAALDRLNSDGFTPLYAACETGKHECVELLLQSKASCDLAAADGRTPLFAASKYGKVSCVRLLLAAAANVELFMEDRTTPLCVAAASGSTECVRALLGASASVDLANETGATPLHEAARGGHEPCVTLLLEANALVDPLNVALASPLYVACEAGRGTCVDLLLRARAHVGGGRAATPGAAPPAAADASADGAAPDPPPASAAAAAPLAATPALAAASPLFAACSVGSAECVALLLVARAAVDELHADGTSPLHVAAHRGHPRCAALLLTARARVDLPDARGVAPLAAAAAAGRVECVRLLLRGRARVDSPAADGRTALHGSAAADQPACVSLLLAANAEVNAPSLAGRTPLHAACAAGGRDAARLLLAASAAVDMPCREGRTPLFAACEGGHAECVELLLRQHARTDVQSCSGYTALMVAGANGHPECMRLLLNAGADMRAKGKNGETILTLVKENTVGHQQCVRMLEAEAAAALLLMEEEVEAGTKKGSSKSKKKKKGKPGGGGVTDPPSPAPLHGWAPEQPAAQAAALEDVSAPLAGRTEAAKAASRATKETQSGRTGKAVGSDAARKAPAGDAAKEGKREGGRLDAAANTSAHTASNGGVETEPTPANADGAATESGSGNGDDDGEAHDAAMGKPPLTTGTSKRQLRQEQRRQAKAAEEARIAARAIEAREAAMHAAAMKALHGISSATSPRSLRAAVHAVTAECAAALPALAAALAKAKERLGEERPASESPFAPRKAPEAPPAPPTPPAPAPAPAPAPEAARVAMQHARVAAAAMTGREGSSDSEGGGSEAGRTPPRAGLPTLAIGAAASLPDATHAPPPMADDASPLVTPREGSATGYLISAAVAAPGVENGVQFKVTRRAVGLIIGTAGERVKALRQKTRADVHISKEEDGSGTVILSGTKESVHQARLAITQLLDAEASALSSHGSRRESKADYQALGHVPPEYVGRLIGAKGGVIQRIRQESGAQVGLSKDTSGWAIVSVDGTPDAVHAAKLSIEQSIGAELHWQRSLPEPPAAAPPAADAPPAARIAPPAPRAWGAVSSSVPPASLAAVDATPSAAAARPIDQISCQTTVSSNGAFRGSCPVCGDALKDGRRFECGHTVCSECTAHWGRCAICSTTQHEDGWSPVEGLPPPSNLAPTRGGVQHPVVADHAAIGSALLAALDEMAAPEFFCPITHELMHDPVCTLDGQTFERHAIEFWLRDHDTSPLTGERLENKMLIPNFIVRSQIRRLLDGNAPGPTAATVSPVGTFKSSAVGSVPNEPASAGPPMLGPARLGPGLLVNGTIGNGALAGAAANAFGTSKLWGGHSDLPTTGQVSVSTARGQGGRGQGHWMPQQGLNPWGGE